MGERPRIVVLAAEADQLGALVARRLAVMGADADVSVVVPTGRDIDRVYADEGRQSFWSEEDEIALPPGSRRLPYKEAIEALSPHPASAQTLMAAEAKRARKAAKRAAIAKATTPETDAVREVGR